MCPLVSFRRGMGRSTLPGVFEEVSTDVIKHEKKNRQFMGSALRSLFRCHSTNMCFAAFRACFPFGLCRSGSVRGLRPSGSWRSSSKCHRSQRLFEVEELGQIISRQIKLVKCCRWFHVEEHLQNFQMMPLLPRRRRSPST